MSGHRCGRALNRDKLNFGKCLLCSTISFIPDLTAEGEGNYHNAQVSILIIHLVTFTKCVFNNIRMEKFSAPSGLHASHWCSGLYDIGATSLAPTGPSPDIYVLPGEWCAVLEEDDCPDPSHCKANRFIHNNYCLPPAFTKAEQCHHPFLYCSFPAGPLFHACECPWIYVAWFCPARLDRFTLITVSFLGFSVCVSV